MDKIGRALGLGLWLAFFAYALTLAGAGAARVFAVAGLVAYIIWTAASGD